MRGFAHEVNNPLFGMLGLVELLLREIEPGTKALRTPLPCPAERPRDQADHALAARLHAVEIRSDRARSRFSDVAEKAVELVRCTSAGKSVELREELPQPSPCSCAEARPASARSFSACSSTLSRPCRPAAPSPCSSSVTGTGRWRGSPTPAPASSRKPRPSLFEPFATTKDGGTGLGLAASLEIARGHGGDLIALTSVSAGASFVLRLPIAGAAE